MPKNIQMEVRNLTEKLKREFCFFQKGSRLPSVRELLASHFCSRQTLKLALDQLKEEGIIRSETRSGLFLCGGERNVKNVLFIRVDWPVLHADELSEKLEMVFGECPGIRFLEMRYPPRELERFLDGLGCFSADLVILWLETVYPKTLLHLFEIGMPVVFFDCGIDLPHAWTFDLQEYMVGMMAAEKLAERGHRKIAYLVDEPVGMTCRAKINGFRDYSWLHHLEAEVIEFGLVNGEHSLSQANELLISYFSRHPIRFSGCFCGHFNLCRDVFVSCGKRIPEDVSVISLDTRTRCETHGGKIAEICYDIDRIAADLAKGVKNFFRTGSFGSYRVKPLFYDGKSLIRNKNYNQ